MLSCIRELTLPRTSPQTASGLLENHGFETKKIWALKLGLLIHPLCNPDQGFNLLESQLTYLWKLETMPAILWCYSDKERRWYMSSHKMKITITLHYCQSELQWLVPFALWILLFWDSNTKNVLKCLVAELVMLKQTVADCCAVCWVGASPSRKQTRLSLASSTLQPHVDSFA